MCRRAEWARRLLAIAVVASLTLDCGVAAAQAQAATDIQPAAPAARGSLAHGTQRDDAGTANDRAPTPKSAASATVPLPAQAVPSASPAPASANTRETDKAALRAPTEGQFRPTGPITVTADRAELIRGDYAVYSGHVVLTSNTLNMDGDRMELRQSAGGQFTARLTGNPAHLHHPSAGPEDPPVTAHAQTLTYDSQTKTVTLEGDAQLTRGHNIVDGAAIDYNTDNHRVQANGGHGGQVKMVIQPPPSTNQRGSAADTHP